MQGNNFSDLEETLGSEAMARLMAAFGGCSLYIPKNNKATLLRRDNQILELYKSNELTIKDIAEKFNLSSRRILSIVSKQLAAREQTPRPR